MTTTIYPGNAAKIEAAQRPRDRAVTLLDRTRPPRGLRIAKLEDAPAPRVAAVILLTAVPVQ